MLNTEITGIRWRIFNLAEALNQVWVLLVARCFFAFLCFFSLYFLLDCYILRLMQNVAPSFSLVFQLCIEMQGNEVN